MKHYLLLLILLSQIFCFAQAEEAILNDNTGISVQSSFRIMGVIDLRTEKDYSSEVKFRTLNHEGGMKVSVLEVLKKDSYQGQKGIWLYVLLTSPIWVDNGDWIEKYRKFLIFLPDDMPIFDFEE
ncbi:MAG TPA: hypothetical protein DCF70_04545 [Treponema sp.]|nr:hypothetical protein [Treponema sp.]